MLQQVGEKVIEKPELEKVRDEQKRLLIDGYVAMVPKWLKLRFENNRRLISVRMVREVVTILRRGLSLYAEEGGQGGAGCCECTSSSFEASYYIDK